MYVYKVYTVTPCIGTLCSLSLSHTHAHLHNTHTKMSGALALLCVPADTESEILVGTQNGDGGAREGRRGIREAYLRGEPGRRVRVRAQEREKERETTVNRERERR
jgi:hypothetical protein